MNVLRISLPKCIQAEAQYITPVSKLLNVESIPCFTNYNNKFNVTLVPVTFTLNLVTECMLFLCFREVLLSGLAN